MINDPFGLGAMSDGASKAIIKLLDVIQVGLGGAFAPWHRIRMAKADAVADKILAQANIDIAALRAEGERQLEALRQRQLPAGPTERPTLDTHGEAVEVVSGDDLEERTRERYAYQEAKRQINVEQVTAQAALDLMNSDASDEPVDPDWIARFFDSIKDVSDADMQKLWARLLAGEVVQPGRFSLRTLERVRNLTSVEAHLFMRCTSVCTVTADIVIPSDIEGSNDIAKTIGLTPSELRTLVDAGLLHPANEHIWGSFGGPTNFSLRYPPMTLSLSIGTTRTVWGAMVHKLTGVGIQLANLQRLPPNLPFLETVADTARHKGFQAELKADPLKS